MSNELTFRQKYELARAHQRPKSDSPDLVVNNSRGVEASLTVLPTTAEATFARSINQPETPPLMAVGQTGGSGQWPQSFLSAADRHPGGRAGRQEFVGASSTRSCTSDGTRHDRWRQMA